jgi:hypothetical protein
MRSHKNVTIYGRYGICAFPLIESGSLTLKTEKVARLDASGLKTFLLAVRSVDLANYEISFSKDGCYALLTRFSEVRNPNDREWSQRVRLLWVQSEQCRR